MPRTKNTQLRITFCLIFTAVIILLLPAWGLAATGNDAPSSWAEEEIASARAKGLVINEAEDNYREAISRELFCRLVVNMVEKVQESQVNITIANPFQDTANSDIIKAYQLGIVNGVSATSFAPNYPITREQIAAMMMRGARKLDDLKGKSYANIDAGNITFTDQNKISAWALTDIRIANRLGIMKGVGNGQINPQGNTTVEQSILLINRLYDGFTGSSTNTGINQAPLALADPVVFTVAEQSELTITASQLASDPAGNELKITGINSNTAIGTTVLTTDGQCKYISHDISASQAYEFTATVTNSQKTADVNVRVNVTANEEVNHTPLALANPVNFTVSEQTALLIEALQLATDANGDALTVVAINGQTTPFSTIYGSAELTSDGKINYISNDITANVIDDFVVTVSDGTNLAPINIRVNVSFTLTIQPIKPALSSVSINGNPAMEETVSAYLISYVGGFPSPSPQLTYQWMMSSAAGGTYTNIAGATASSYQIPQSAVGKYLKLKVTASGSASGSITSAAIGPVTYGFAAGSGTAADPYQIATAKQFMLLNTVPTENKYFKLTNDITLATNTYISETFYGTLYGYGHNITLNITASPGNYVGLFSTTAGAAQIRTVNVSGNIATTYNCAGGIAGRNDGTINSCFSEVNLEANDYTGGITGLNIGTVTLCSSAATIDAHDYVGSITGKNNGTVSRCSTSDDSDVTANAMAGGLVGINASAGTVIYCHSAGSVFANGNEGGLIGWNEGSIIDCYATGQVNGYNNKGGLVGHNNGGIVSRSYYNKETSGQSDTGRGIPKTTAEMKTKATYNGWDFANIWNFTTGNYPYLR